MIECKIKAIELI